MTYPNITPGLARIVVETGTILFSRYSRPFAIFENKWLNHPIYLLSRHFFFQQAFRGEGSNGEGPQSFFEQFVHPAVEHLMPERSYLIKAYASVLGAQVVDKVVGVVFSQIRVHFGAEDKILLQNKNYRVVHTWSGRDSMIIGEITSIFLAAALLITNASRKIILAEVGLSLLKIALVFRRSFVEIQHRDGRVVTSYRVHEDGTILDETCSDTLYDGQGQLTDSAKSFLLSKVPLE